MEDALERWQSEKTASYLANAVAAAEHDPGSRATGEPVAEDLRKISNGSGSPR